MFVNPPPLGNLVRLRPLALADLPAHPAFGNLLGTQRRNPESSESSNGSTQSPEARSKDRNRPSLRDFISAVLTEATTFVDTTLPATFSTISTPKQSKPAHAKVELLKRMVTPSELDNVPWATSTMCRTKAAHAQVGEAWFSRRSRHANHSEEGTADWPEFDEGLRVEHSVKERLYTPDVYDSYRVLDWDEETKEMVLDSGWREVDMRIYEMAHSLPFPLRPRVFPVVIITACAPRGPTADAQQPNSLIVVQIPVDISSLPQALYSNNRNIRVGDSSLKRKKVVMGVYTSIEKCSMGLDMNIEWIMATASDAKGWLPMWAQKLGVPGAVVKDVGLFVDWVGKQRHSS